MDNPTFASALSAAREVYGEIDRISEHNDRKVLEFCARAVVVYRESRRDPEAFRRAKLDCGVKDRRNLRPEDAAIRVAAGNGKLRQPHWVNCVAYVAAPPNGDPAPDSYETAFAYIKQREGVRQLSDLWRAWKRGEDEKIDANKAVEDLLFDITPDFSAARYYSEGQDDFQADGFALALIRLDKAADGWVLYGSDRQLISMAKRIKTRSTIREGIDAYVQRMRRKAIELDNEEEADPDWREAAD